VVRRVFETKREEITRKWRELYNEKLHNSCILNKSSEKASPVTLIH
jgi:hypothetical protein